ncbi:hypothetical protein [Streptomyces sp. NPDC093097]
MQRERDSNGAGELVCSLISGTSPAWQRILDALAHRAEQRRTARHDS